MQCPLPELLLWIFGSNEIVTLFTESFVNSLQAKLHQIQNGGTPCMKKAIIICAVIAAASVAAATYIGRELYCA